MAPPSNGDDARGGRSARRSARVAVADVALHSSQQNLAAPDRETEIVLVTMIAERTAGASYWAAGATRRAHAAGPELTRTRIQTEVNGDWPYRARHVSRVPGASAAPARRWQP